jgi:NADPH:quinone reductase-like Zn-dependent oxidoreductase
MRRGNGRTFKPGDRVLIDGASGNVGPFAVQIAKAMGAEVTGVASGHKLEFVRSLGADHVIDYTTVDYTRTGERYDWIVAVDAHHPIRAARRALKPGGVYLTMGGDTGTIFAALGGSLVMSRFGDKWSGMMLWWKPMHRPDVATLKELIAAGELKPVIDRRYPLSQVVEALRHVDEGRATGKVVITMEES